VSAPFNSQFGGKTYAIGEASTCRMCGQLKSIDQFHRSPLYLSGHDSRCKACYVGHGRHDFPGSL